MTDVVVSGLSKHYGTKAALHSLDLAIASGEFVTLLGPSGCGKTTTLRCLAGLERPSGGTIAMGGRTVVDSSQGLFVLPEKRHVGMVFQSYALWPHMTVSENVAYPLKVAKVAARERQSRVRRVLDAVGLVDLEKRSVTALSGGQQQRVALARALVARPGIIFYDEPLSNLDTRLRYQMGQQVRTLHNEFQTTSVYVTHDQEEAITLSDRIVVMNQGRIEQQGSPEELYDRPRTAFVADFMGFQNVMEGTVVAVDGYRVDVRVAGSSLVLTAHSEAAQSLGASVSLAFRAGHVRLQAEGSASGPGRFSGTVARTTFLGSAYNVLLDADGLTIKARFERSELDRHGLKPPMPGETLHVEVNAQRAVIVEAEGAVPDAPSTSAPVSALV